MVNNWSCSSQSLLTNAVSQCFCGNSALLSASCFDLVWKQHTNNGFLKGFFLKFCLAFGEFAAAFRGSLLLDQVCKGKMGHTWAGGNYCIRVFNSVKGVFLRSSRAQKHKVEPAWPFISPGNTKGNWTQCKCRRANSSVFGPQKVVIMVVPALIRLPKAGKSWGQGAEWGTEGAGQNWTDVRYKEGSTWTEEIH